MEIIVKKGFEAHYNNAFEKVIHTRKEYDYEMKKGGFVPFEKGCQLAESKKQKEYKPSVEIREKLNYLKDKSDGKGNIRHPEDLRKLYKDSGLKFELPDWCPKHYKPGNFQTTDEG